MPLSEIRELYNISKDSHLSNLKLNFKLHLKY